MIHEEGQYCDMKGVISRWMGTTNSVHSSNTCHQTNRDEDISMLRAVSFLVQSSLEVNHGVGVSTLNDLGQSYLPATTQTEMENKIRFVNVVFTLKDFWVVYGPGMSYLLSGRYVALNTKFSNVVSSFWRTISSAVASLAGDSTVEALLYG